MFKWRVNLQNPKHPTTHLNRGRTQVCTLSLAIPLSLPRHATHSPGPVNNKHYFFKAPYKMCIIIIIRTTKACPVITLSLFLSAQLVLPKWVPTGIPSHQHQCPLSTGWETSSNTWHQSQPQSAAAAYKIQVRTTDWAPINPQNHEH